MAGALGVAAPALVVGGLLLSGVLQSGADRLSHGTSLDQRSTAAVLDAVGLALTLPAAVLAILVIRVITERQGRAVAAGERNAPLPPTLPTIPARDA